VFLFFAVLVIFLVIYQYAKGGVWDRGWRWHRREEEPGLFWLHIVMQLLAAIIFAGVHFWRHPYR
jgi:hypothetical protein